ncbi:hypothetical protein FA15DRAFT_75531 [Coprinopsis marcescibilis]|uniref:Uncharacterized protein n=1 Tax=Coprinopsis marcescibilis TaxID=230819 RepID=A0A5C3L6C9_COPMA|nr:hypothetical protein FA15DRAFT_75531 [Coprinopsis marcescibilis]
MHADSSHPQPDPSLFALISAMLPETTGCVDAGPRNLDIFLPRSACIRPGDSRSVVYCAPVWQVNRHGTASAYPLLETPLR